jgi:DNA-binding beta-propeller fold protein YncE
MQLPVRATESVLAALGEIGRTEDVQFSPDNTQLAIAGFRKDRILVLDVTIGGGEVVLTDCLNVESPAFQYPHGLFWLDSETLIVANRTGEVPIVSIAGAKPVARTLTPTLLQTIHRDDTDLLRSPGSVTARRIGRDLVEVLVCNNYAHYVSRHLLDASRRYAMIFTDIVAAAPLDIPDGIAQAGSARWFAVSNHRGHNVLLYRNPAGLTAGPLRPAGVLHAIAYPHGLRFTPDERFILVADAGSPFVYLYASDTGDWYGNREPVASLRVIDEESFRRGQASPEEGGPKGLDIDRHGSVIVVSCEEQPIVFVDIRGELAAAGVTGSGPAPEPQIEDERELLVGRLEAANRELGTLRGDLNRVRHELAATTSSVRWRMTAPLRRLMSRLRR